MAQVKVTIAGRSYDLACHPGEEEHLTLLASRVDAKAAEARQAIGGMNEVRQLLLAALLLADDIEQGPGSSAAPQPQDEDGVLSAAIDQMADRIEILAERLEKVGAAS